MPVISYSGSDGRYKQTGSKLLAPRGGGVETMETGKRVEHHRFRQSGLSQALAGAATGRAAKPWPRAATCASARPALDGIQT